MSKTRHIPFLALAAFALAACTQDKPAEQGTALPEGAYPITFSAVQVAGAEPQTRVSENADGTGSVWTDGDKIEIEFYELGGDNQYFHTTFTVDASGNVIAQSPQLYWPNTSNYTYEGMYCNIAGESTTDKTVSFGDQSQGLAYVLLASGSANCHSGEIALTFKHKLNKVRVKFEGEKADDVASVSVKNYTSVNVNSQTVMGRTEGYIAMHKVTSGDETYWEANVAPAVGTDPAQIQDFRLYRSNGTYVDCKLDAPIDPNSIEGGKMFTVTINVKSAVVQDGATLTEAGDYTMSGTYTQGITINGDGINLTLDGATINSSGIGINITGGNPTIKVSGTENSVTSQTNTAVAVASGASVTITGVNGRADKLMVKGGGTNTDNTVQGGAAGAGIGSTVNATAGGDIIIENVTIDATGATSTDEYGFSLHGGAGIGCAGPGCCGDITITNATVTAKGGFNSAAIGMGNSTIWSSPENSKMGNISITRSEITATCGYGAAVIGFPYTLMSTSAVTGGTITIVTDESADTFLSRLTLSGYGATGGQFQYPYKIGKGGHSPNMVTVTFGGVTLTASDGTQTSADGIAQWTD